MRILLLIALVTMISSPSFAGTCSGPEAIAFQWGYVADTANGKITAWRHQTEPQPDKAAIDTAITDCSIETTRNSKKEELWNEAERRFHVYLPGTNLISMYHLWVSIDNKTPDSSVSAAISYYQPWKTARDTLNNFTGIASINAFDAITSLP